MTTQTVAGLEGLIGALGAKIPIPSYPNADVQVRPLDIGRSYLADLLCSIIQGDTSNVFGSIQSPSNIDNGDLVVILPKLSHGSDPDEFGRLIMQKVSPVHARSLGRWADVLMPVASSSALCSSFPFRMECICGSCSRPGPFLVCSYHMSMIARKCTVGM